MVVFLLIVIIFLMAPWLLDIALFITIALIVLVFIVAGCIYLYFGNDGMFQMTFWTILILAIKNTIYDNS